jgi:hypothetical protein
MKWMLLLVLMISMQPLFAQLDIEPLTGFRFKMNKQEALAAAEKQGGYVPEALKGERNLLLYGMKLLGYPNSMVLVQLYDNQLYNVGVSVDAKNAEEQTARLEKILALLSKKYGKPSTTEGGMLFWMIGAGNADADRIILVKTNNHSLNIQFTDGELLKLAQPAAK